MRRTLDILFSILLLLIFSGLLFLIYILVKASSEGPALYWSERVGKNNKIFLMPKFRSMRVGTPQLASHLIAEPGKYITWMGRILRKTSLDELPQLWSILRGDMSFIGPRPALFNQYDLIELRTQRKIHTLLPGITGWAQVNGRDEISNERKVELDEYYLINKSVPLNFKIVFLTVVKVLGVSHVSH